jgi:glutamine synthetase adenylyltransferase
LQKPSLPLAAYQEGWKETIHKMRLRIEKERTPKGKDHLAIKTGTGGLMDAEFVAQALCMERGWRQPNTLQALQQAFAGSALPNGQELIENYRRLRRVEGVLRRWSYEGEILLPDAPEPFYRVSVRCGFSSPEEFSSALAGCRKAIRAGYDQVFKQQGAAG